MKGGLLKLKEDLQDKYGKNSVMFAGDMPKRDPISSGSLALDFATGIGGLPSDRVIEVAGGEGCGKTTLGLFTMKNFLDQQPERAAVIIDTEHKLTDSWVEYLVGEERMSRILVLWPDTMEQATDMYTKCVSSGEVSMVLFDSIGGSPSQRVTNKSAESGNIGGNALSVTRWAQLAAIYSQKYHCLTFAVNQVREDMSGYRRHITPGGRGFKHAVPLRIQMKRGRGKLFDKIDGEELQVGFSVVAKLVKNQLGGIEGRTAWWWFYSVPTEKYGFGIDTLEEIVRLGITVRVIQQAGAWYSHHGLPGGKIKSKDALYKVIRDSEELKGVIVKETLETLKQGGELVNRVAPISDPDAPIDDPTVMMGDVFLDQEEESGEEYE